MRLLKVGLVTCAAVPGLSPDDRLLADEIERRGHGAQAAVWDDPRVAWTDFDALVLRSVWDYHRRATEFLAWLAARESEGLPLWNPAPLVRRNVHKSYLRGLEESGVPIGDTAWLTRGTSVSLGALLAERGWERAVVKPAISACAFETFVVDRGEAGGQARRLEALLAVGDVLVQRFLPEIATGGEWSMVFVSGDFSHAVLKRPAPGDFRVQEAFGGTSVALTPAPRLVAQASTIAAAIERPWLYARIDGVDREGLFILVEAELIEPVLFLALAQGAAARLADALLTFCGASLRGDNTPPCPRNRAQTTSRARLLVRDPSHP